MTSTDAVRMPRCSAWAREVAVDPIGTAGTYRGIVAIEWPLPWPRDVADVPELADAVRILASLGVRVQLVRPPTEPHDGARILSFRRDEETAFRRFARREETVESAALAEVAVALGRGQLHHALDDETVDVLVCTHGARDVCCGSDGTRLMTSLSARTDALPSAVRLWSTSHLGGHRFAPTALVMPSGTCWGFLDTDRLTAIVGRAGSADDVLPFYRGCAGVGPRRAQALERVAFREVGWSWLEHQRRGRELDGGVVEINATSPDGDALVWSGFVIEGRSLPVPACRAPLDTSAKSESELVVAAYRRER